MDISSWIVGLMRENYDAVGFIPDTTIRDRYIRHGQFILQKDEHGNPIGYLLHGVIKCASPCVVTQHVIQYEKRNRGYGQKAFSELLRRCESIGASSIHLRCAVDLDAVMFWQSCGFMITNFVSGGEKRNRIILEMKFALELPLFEKICLKTAISSPISTTFPLR